MSGAKPIDDAALADAKYFSKRTFRKHSPLQLAKPGPSISVVPFFIATYQTRYSSVSHVLRASVFSSRQFLTSKVSHTSSVGTGGAFATSVRDARGLLLSPLTWRPTRWMNYQIIPFQSSVPLSLAPSSKESSLALSQTSRTASGKRILQRGELSSL